MLLAVYVGALYHFATITALHSFDTFCLTFALDKLAGFAPIFRLECAPPVSRAVSTLSGPNDLPAGGIDGGRSIRGDPQLALCRRGQLPPTGVGRFVFAALRQSARTRLSCLVGLGAGRSTPGLLVTCLRFSADRAKRFRLGSIQIARRLQPLHTLPVPDCSSRPGAEQGIHRAGLEAERGEALLHKDADLARHRRILLVSAIAAPDRNAKMMSADIIGLATVAAFIDRSSILLTCHFIIEF